MTPPSIIHIFSFFSGTGPRISQTGGVAKSVVWISCSKLLLDKAVIGYLIPVLKLLSIL